MLPPAACIATWCLSCSWSKAAPQGSSGGGLSKGALAAAVAVPIICVGLLLGCIGAFVWRRRSRRAHSPAGTDVDDVGGKSAGLPLFIKRGGPGAQGGSGPGSDGSGKGSPGGTPMIVAVKESSLATLETEGDGASGLGAIGVGPDRQTSATSSSLSGTNKSKAQSGFSDNIAQVSWGFD